MAYYLFRYSKTPWLVVGAVLAVAIGWGYHRRRKSRLAPV
jgi:hypothetical protein